uniref:Uncharacterized protein n=1 Tax=Oryza punctata TaxID=4537 RepID=A0A0E0KYY7_ORYPU
MEALRQEVDRAEAKAQRLAREATRTTESAKTTCRTLRLALNNMGAKARGVPGENASALEFCEWTQQAGCAVSDCATAYGRREEGGNHEASTHDRLGRAAATELSLLQGRSIDHRKDVDLSSDRTGGAVP